MIVINPQDKRVTATISYNTITVTNNDTGESITVQQPIDRIITVNHPGPIGPQGPVGTISGSSVPSSSFSSTSSFAQSGQGAFSGSFSGSFQGDGSSLTGIVSSKWTGSSTISRLGNVEITGSLTISGSSTLRNIGPAQFTGSLIVTNGITGSLEGTSSWALTTISSSISVSSSYTTNGDFIRISGSSILNDNIIIEGGTSSITNYVGSFQIQAGAGGSQSGSINLSNYGDPTDKNGYSLVLFAQDSPIDIDSDHLIKIGTLYTPNISIGRLVSTVTITGSLIHLRGPVTASIISASSGLTGSLFGTSSWAVSSSFARNGNGTFSGSFSGSYVGDGSNLTGIVSSKWTGSTVISRLGDVIITGSLLISASRSESYADFRTLYNLYLPQVNTYQDHFNNSGFSDTASPTSSIYFETSTGKYFYYPTSSFPFQVYYLASETYVSASEAILANNFIPKFTTFPSETMERTNNGPVYFKVKSSGSNIQGIELGSTKIYNQNGLETILSVESDIYSGSREYFRIGGRGYSIIRGSQTFILLPSNSINPYGGLEGSLDQLFYTASLSNTPFFNILTDVNTGSNQIDLDLLAIGGNATSGSAGRPIPTQSFSITFKHGGQRANSSIKSVGYTSAGFPGLVHTSYLFEGWSGSRYINFFKYDGRERRFTITGSLNVSGSAITGSIISASLGFTGSLFGTSSWATNASQSISSSVSITSSYSITASHALNGGSSNINTGSFATTGSNNFIGTENITGSLRITGSLFLIPLNNDDTLTEVLVRSSSGEFFYRAASSLLSSGSLTPAGGPLLSIQFNSASAFSGSSKWTYDYINDRVNLTGSLGATSLTGSLFGTSSYADNGDFIRISGSSTLTDNITVEGGSSSMNVFVGGIEMRAGQPSSYSGSVLISNYGDPTDKNGYALTLFSQDSPVDIDSTYLIKLGTAYTQNVSIGRTLSTVNITGSLINLRGSVTASIISASSGFTGSLFGTSSWAINSSQSISSSVAISSSRSTFAISSSYATSSANALTSSLALFSISSSYATSSANSITASLALFSISSSYASSSANSITSSLASFAISASYATSSANAISASYIDLARSSSNAINAQSASVAISSSWANFSVSSSYATSSANSITSSLALFAVSASYATSSANAITASYIDLARSASNAINAQSSSVAISSSWSAFAISSSYATSSANALTASFVALANSASNAVNAQSASVAISSSISQTSSFARSGDGIFSGSFSGSYVGDGSGLTGIAGGSSKWTGSTTISRLSDVVITGSLIVSSSLEYNILGTTQFTGPITASIISGSAVTGSLQGTSSWAINSSQSISSSVAISSSWSTQAVTASYITYSNIANKPIIKTGITGGGVFSGIPLTHIVTFSNAFPDNNYSVFISAEVARSFTVQSKVSGSFTINTNSSTAFTENVFWQAITTGSFG